MEQIVLISGKGSSGKTHEFIRRRLSLVPGMPGIKSADGAVRCDKEDRRVCE
ncbi:MAG: hypothetical protein KAR25_06965 [Methanosarcinales archaeon]|nr:hypothetical protein [Methanosarcinales archaeon]